MFIFSLNNEKKIKNKQKLQVLNQTHPSKTFSQNENSAVSLNLNETQNVYTVDDAIEYFGFGRFQILISLFAGFSWVFLFF